MPSAMQEYVSKYRISNEKWFMQCLYNETRSFGECLRSCTRKASVFYNRIRTSATTMTSSLPTFFFIVTSIDSEKAASHFVRHLYTAALRGLAVILGTDLTVRIRISPPYHKTAAEERRYGDCGSQ